jgi:hypothetical protein
MRRVDQLIAVVAALAVLAGCGDSGGDRTTAERPSGTVVPKTGGPATPPATLKAKGYVVIPRTNVALRPPEGFVVEPSLPGLVRRGTRSSILVIQTSSPYDDPDKVVDDLAGGLENDEAGARQGLEFESVERISVDGRPAIGAVGTQTVQEGTFDKAVVMFPSEGQLVTVSATLESGDPATAADALAVLRAARWSTKAGRGSLGFTVTPAPGYGKHASSAGLAYSLKRATGPDEADFVASPSLGTGPIPPDERRDLARSRFGELPGDPVAGTEKRVTIAGLPGWEFTGTGKEDGRDRRYYAAVLFTDAGYLALVGTFDPDRHKDQLGAFRSMAHSLELSG